MKHINFDYKTKKKLKYTLDTDSSDIESIEKIRKAHGRVLPLTDANETPLWYNLTDEAKANIEKIKSIANQRIEDFIPKKYLSSTIESALIDEALGSSAIEGAYSSRSNAKKLIEEDLKPSNKDQMMIKNNYKGLKFVLANIEQEIDKAFIVKLWEILTTDTLNEEDISEGYRDDKVFVQKAITGEKIHEGTPANKIDDKTSQLLKYINNYSKDEVIVKACILHYVFLDIHPFFDGNGRTARALMSKYLIEQGYIFFKYYSISKILNPKRNQYYQAIKNSQEHENDLTFFIDFYTKLTLETLVTIKKTYINHYITEIIDNILKENNIYLNERQHKAVSYFYNKSILQVDNESYKEKFDVTQETARKDLNKLWEIGLIKKKKRERKYIYRRISLSEIIENVEEF